MNIEKAVSYVIHPIIFGIIATLSYFIINPKFLPKDLKFHIIGIVFISTYLIPIIFLFLLKSFNTIDSFHLSSIDERKFPLFFFIVLNALLSYRLFQIPNLELLALFFLASSISLFIVYFSLYFGIKISLHTLSLSLFTTFILILSYVFKIRLIFLLSFLILLSGYISYVRLKLKVHTALEVYLGYLIGIIIEFTSFYIMFYWYK